MFSKAKLVSGTAAPKIYPAYLGWVAEQRIAWEPL
jgi:hypothetical protein